MDVKMARKAVMTRNTVMIPLFGGINVLEKTFIQIIRARSKKLGTIRQHPLKDETVRVFSSHHLKFDT